MCLTSIGIDDALILASLVEEVELDINLVPLLVALAANEPVIGTLSLASHSDVLARLGIDIPAVVPVESHVADELEGIHILFIVLRQVGCHLQRAAHNHIESQLSNKRGVDDVVVLTPVFKTSLKHSWSIVHGTTLESGER